MNVDELETLKAALEILDRHKHPVAADSLRDVLVDEFSRVARTLREGRE